MANSRFKIDKSIEYGESRFAVSLCSSGYIGLNSEWRYIGMAETEADAIAIIETFKHGTASQIVSKSRSTFPKYYE